MKKKTTRKKTGAERTPAVSVAPRKLGSDRRGTAVKPRKIDKNFKQSKDVREDRGTRQFKTGAKNRAKGR